MNCVCPITFCTSLLLLTCDLDSEWGTGQSSSGSLGALHAAVCASRTVFSRVAQVVRAGVVSRAWQRLVQSAELWRLSRVA